MEESKSRNFYLTLTIILWSLIPAVAKIALEELDNYQVLLYTIILGIISLSVINILKKRTKYFLTYTKWDYLKMFGMGFLGIFLYHIFLFGSFDLAPAGQVNVINYLWPLFVIILSIFILKENYNFKTIIAIIISFLGAFVAFSNGNFSIFKNEFLLGYFLATLGAICYALFSTLGKKLHYEKYSSMLIYFISAGIVVIPSSILRSGFIIPKSVKTIVALILLGGVINSVSFVFWFKALKLGHTHKTTNLIYIVPFIAMIWTFFLNSEPFSIYSVLGLILIMCGIFIQLNNHT